MKVFRVVKLKHLAVVKRKHSAVMKWQPHLEVVKRKDLTLELGFFFWLSEGGSFCKEERGIDRTYRKKSRIKIIKLYYIFNRRCYTGRFGIIGGRFDCHILYKVAQVNVKYVLFIFFKDITQNISNH